MISFSSRLRTASLLPCTGALLAAFTACNVLTDAGDDAPDVRGSWAYSATQSSSPVELTGTLTITAQSGASFDAQLEVQERDGQGTITNRSGIVAGRIIGSDGIDFDVFFETTPRRHVGRVEADSMTGSWVELDPTRTGLFHARRNP